MKQNVLDLTAKLLATENINVFRKPVKESTFDIKTRTLLLPQWKGLTKEVETTLIGREVGHALYTTKKLGSLVGNDKHLKQYAKIIDDIRVEKLVKRKFPGIAKDFSQGYKTMSADGYFGNKNAFGSMNLIDRINLQSKLGYEAGVDFDEQERALYEAVEACNSEEDVANVARKVLEYAKQDPNNQMPEDSDQDGDGEGGESEDKTDGNKPDNSSDSTDGVGSGKSDNKETPNDSSDNDSDSVPDSDEDDESEESDSDEDDGENEGGEGNGSVEESKPSEPQVDESKLDSKTADAIKANVDLDTNSEFNYVKLDDNIFEGRIMAYKDILKATEILNDRTSGTLFDRYFSSINSTVAYLTKEFEMRKNATQLKRAQVSKTGALDSRKLYAYKLKEDLFKSVTTLPNGKNHGMIFLLDWSGSMDSMLDDTIAQLIPLAYFCHKNQIKYKVLAFTDGANRTHAIDNHTSKAASKLKVDTYTSKMYNETSSFRLMEFFSDSMSNSEFKTMAKRLFKSASFRRIDGFGTSGTPLNAALGFLTTYIGTFLKQTKVEKFSLMTLSDGESTSIYSGGGYSYGGKHVTNVMRDPVTKLEYHVTSSASNQTFNLVKMIKDRYQCNTIGFYVGSDVGNSSYYRRSILESNCCSDDSALVDKYKRTFTSWDEAKKQYADKGYVSVSGTAYDEFFYIPQDSLSNSNKQSSKLDLDPRMTSHQVAAALTDSMNSKIKSKILLNRFVQLIA